jgi:hypothetical protein
VSSRARKLSLALAALVCGGAAVDAAFSANLSGDYQVGGPIAGDNAAPAITALIHGNLSAYASHQPLMGPVSLLLRAPFTGIATALGAGHFSGYEVGALVCLLLVAGSAAWLLAAAAPAALRGRDSSLVWVAGLAAVYVLFGPVTHEAVAIGHPEEPLAGAFVTAAVLAALAGRGGLAGVALGLAVGTKEWALIGVLPVVIALPARRIRAITIAAGVAAVLYAPGAIIDPAALGHAGHMLADKRLVNPFSIWWPLGQPLHVAGFVSGTVRLLPAGSTRLRLVELLALAGLVLSPLVWLAFRRGVRVRDPLAALALLGLLRAITDPLPQEYYFLALLIPLAAWELAAIGRVPVVSLVATLFVDLVPGAHARLSAGGRSLLSLAFSVSLAAYLAYRSGSDPAARAPWIGRLSVTLCARWRSSSSRPASPMAPASPASSKAYRPG